MVKFGIDVYDGSDSYSGFKENGRVTGFSLMHESGTGGAPKYGVVSQMPVMGNISNPLEDLSVARAKPDMSAVGHYTTNLVNGIQVELAATRHAGIYRYQFPTDEDGNIVVDISQVLPSYRKQGLGQAYTGGSFEVLPDGHYEGFGTYNNGWNRSPDWNIYFCGYFDDAPSSFSVFQGTNSKLSHYGDIKSASGKYRQGAVFTWDRKDGSSSATNQVISRVGVSWISSSQACDNVNTEIAKGMPFDVVVGATKNVWNTQVFSKVTTSETDSNVLKQLYTSLYGMHLLPSNRTGENPGWSSSEPYYDDFFTFWDLWRCTTSLLQILQPQVHEEVVRSLIDTYEHEHWLPDARSSNYNGRTQGGSNADNILADAYVKGVAGGVDWSKAFDAVETDAQEEPLNHHDPMASDASTKEGRGGITDWKSIGFMSTKYTRSVSRAVDYSVNDYAVYQLSKGLNEPHTAYYLNRSRQWRNHYDPAATSNESQGISGFLVPKDENGTFLEQDPLSCGGCYWGDDYYEGLPWEYTFGPIHDIPKLVQLSGGADAFLDKLLMVFKGGVNKPGGVAEFNYTIFNVGNEPDFATPYLFNFIGRQDLTVQIVRHIVDNFYGLGPNALPGNSDAGAMQSWLLWANMGLYPLTTTKTFLIGAPAFSDLTLDLGSSRTLHISSTNLSPGQADNMFVQSLKVNGQNWTKAWLLWDDVFAKGGTLEFVLGTQRVDWATGDLPPYEATETDVPALRVASPAGGVFPPPPYTPFVE
jgi:predicted alpha-1,2-mannosidase